MAKRPNISGRYRSASGGQELHLRVDVGPGAPVDPVSGTALQCLSGDLFDPPAGKCIGSFIAKQVIRKSSTVVEGIGTDGTGEFAPRATGLTVRVTVGLSSTRPRKPVSARVEFLDSRGEEVVPARVCRFVDRNFREVSWQLVCLGEADALIPFGTKLKHGKMTVTTAFKRAGFKLTGGTVLRNVSPEETAGDRWSDAELHAAMQEHCRSLRDQPQWNVCVLAAPRHEKGVHIRGIMFDRAGAFPRQGCAVFSGVTNWTRPSEVRDQLFDYAHEIGHVFNIPHSWDREHGVPLLPQGPNQGSGELSWMNYPSHYVPAGTSHRDPVAYWSNFEFRFTPTEVNYLRHALYGDIVPGGKEFVGADAASAVVREQAFEPRATDAPDLTLELRSSRKFVLGEPVIVEVKLAKTGDGERTIHTDLHPRYGNVQIGIRHAGCLRRYRPPIVYCTGKVEPTTLGVESLPVYTSGYLGYGREGLYFGEPGRYELVACYVAPDGSRVVTDPKQPLILDIDWPPQGTPLDAEVTKLLLGEQQGMLFWLGGSDKLEEIAAGRDAFGKLLNQFGGHPLARYVKFVQGINLGRPFKRLTVDGRISIRPAIPKPSAQAFSEFVEWFRGDLTFDNLTLNFGMRRLARSLHLAGRRKEAGEMLESILPTFVDRVSKARKEKGEPQTDVDKKIGDKIRKQVAEERDRWSQPDLKKKSSRA